MNNIYDFFPEKIQEILIDEIGEKQDVLEEIRIRVIKPIVLKFNDEEKIIKYYVSSEEILLILQLICENSIYSYQKEIADRICYCKRWT